MFSWLCENIATIIICVILIALVTSIVIYMLHGKKKGKSSCGCGCANCPMSGDCHKEN